MSFLRDFLSNLVQRPAVCDIAFHERCGQAIKLCDRNRTAARQTLSRLDIGEFQDGLVLSNRPLEADELFEVRFDKKIDEWYGSIEIGVTVCEPKEDLPACAAELGNGTWMMSGNSVLKDGNSLIDIYGQNLESLNEGDFLGVMRTSNNDLIFYVNGESQGIAASNIPRRVFAVVDLYGKCAGVSIGDSSKDATPTSTSSTLPGL